MLDFDAFAARADAIAASIPSEFMEGVDAVDVLREARPHAHVPDVYTLGECATSHLSDPTGQEPLRSVVRIYFGSFAAVAEDDPDFDVDAELRETIEHEVQHHLEDRAGWSDLRNEDDLFEAHARFRAGLDTPAGWYRQGDALARGIWAVDLDLFIELELRRRDWDRLPGTRLCLNILDESFEVDVPDDALPDEIWSFEGEGLIEGDDEDEDEVIVADPEDDEGPGPAGDLHVVPIVR